jgi:hypothetical protein
METEGGVMKRKSSLRLIRRLGLALAVAAFAAPTAQAVPIISDEGAVAAAPQVLYADDLHATLPRPVSSEPVATAPQVLYADDLHAMLPRPVSSEPRTQVSHVAPASTGFDWSDASIGAVGAFAVMLLGVGVLLAGRHNRRSRLAAI